MNITSANTSRADLLSRAQNYGSTVASDETNPYKRADGAENDFFLANIDRFQGESLGEIKANVDASAAANAKKARYATLGGLALVAGGFLGPALLGIPGPVGTGMLFGGIILANVVGGRASQAAAVDQKFSQQLGDWANAIQASSGQQPPAQPPAAPAPPAEQKAAA